MFDCCNCTVYNANLCGNKRCKQFVEIIRYTKVWQITFGLQQSSTMRDNKPNISIC